MVEAPGKSKSVGASTKNNNPPAVLDPKKRKIFEVSLPCFFLHSHWPPHRWTEISPPGSDRLQTDFSNILTDVRKI
jgi:hypothetical protein